MWNDVFGFEHTQYTHTMAYDAENTENTTVYIRESNGENELQLTLETGTLLTVWGLFREATEATSDAAAAAASEFELRLPDGVPWRVASVVAKALCALCPVTPVNRAKMPRLSSYEDLYEDLVDGLVHELLADKDADALLGVLRVADMHMIPILGSTLTTEIEFDALNDAGNAWLAEHILRDPRWDITFKGDEGEESLHAMVSIQAVRRILGIDKQRDEMLQHVKDMEQTIFDNLVKMTSSEAMQQMMQPQQGNNNPLLEWRKTINKLSTIHDIILPVCAHLSTRRNAEIIGQFAAVQAMHLDRKMLSEPWANDALTRALDDVCARTCETLKVATKAAT